MKNNKIYFLIGFFMFKLLVFAQNKTEEFDNFKSKYNSTEFQYIVKEEINKEPKENIFSKFIIKLAELLSQLPWPFIFYISIALFLILIGYQIYKKGGFFKQNSKTIIHETDFNYIEENLAEIDLNKLISRAESSQNYPLAIRYWHYQNLQNLAKKDFIEWDTKKTNQQFINQIKEQNIRNQFIENTNIFNKAWFGEFVIDSTLYNSLKEKFNQFNHTLSA